MMQDVSDDLPRAEPDDPLRLTICPNCFYNLHGLPLGGICPECGEKYDQSAIILYGWPPSELSEMGQSGRTHALGALIMLPFIAALIYLSGNAIHGMLNLVLFALVVFSGFWLRMLQRCMLHAPARVQMRFDAIGCHTSTRTGELTFGPKRFLAWRNVGRFTIMPHKASGYVVYVGSSNWMRRVFNHDYFLVVVELTEAQQAELYDRVAHWRADARSLMSPRP